MPDNPRRRRSEDFAFRSGIDKMIVSDSRFMESVIYSRWIVVIIPILAIVTVVSVIFTYFVTSEMTAKFSESDEVVASLAVRTQEVLAERDALKRALSEQREGRIETVKQLEDYQSAITALQQQVARLSVGLRQALISRPGNQQVHDIDKLISESRNQISRLSSSLFQVSLVYRDLDEDTLSAVLNLLFLEMGFRERSVREISGWPSFFSKKAAVFYYDETAKDKANSIAVHVGDLIGRKIVPTIGAGTGINEDDRKNTIIVHLSQ